MDAGTVFDDRLSDRLNGLAPGAWAEVYALYDPALQRYRATRVDVRPVQPVTYRLRGVPTQHDPVARTLHFGAAVFDYGGAAGAPVGLANAPFVRMTLQRTPLASGVWQVLAFSAAQRRVGDRDEAVVKGLVTSLASASAFGSTAGRSTPARQVRGRAGARRPRRSRGRRPRRRAARAQGRGAQRR